MSIARRKAGEQYYWRATQWMAPMFSIIPSAAWPIGGRAWVPIDDENTYCWDFSYTFDEQLPQSFIKSVEEGRRSEEHTSELQSRGHLVCRLLLEKKNNSNTRASVRT